MLPIAGQTAGLNGLNFFVETRGELKKIRHFFQLFFSTFSFPRATLGPSASMY